MKTRSGLAVFESAIEDAYLWINEIQEKLDTDPHQALAALRAALHTLRDRLSVEQTAHLAAQLPTLIRGLYFEGWVPSHTPNRERHLEQFLSHLHHELGRNAIVLVEEHVGRVVFGVLARHVSPGAIDNIIDSLPHEVRDLWTT